MPVVGDGDYQVGATASLATCMETATTAVCPAGQACIGGLCEATCAADSDCPSKWGCNLLSGQSDAVCMPQCNPVFPQLPDATHVACDPGVTCQPIAPAGGGAFTDCLAVAASGTEGQACTDYTDCAPGYGCIDDGAGPACRAFCRVGQGDCAAGLTCTPLVPAFADGAVALGNCTQ